MAVLLELLVILFPLIILFLFGRVIIQIVCGILEVILAIPYGWVFLLLMVLGGCG